MYDPRTNSSVASREELKLQALRERNEQRRQRFLNAKTRTLGVDTAALDRQVAEKRAKKEAERAAEMSYAEEQRQIRRVLEMNLLEERQQQQQDRMEVAQVVQVQRDPTLTREWDLNNPDSLKNEQAPRVGDFDPRCGPSSLQMFSGEDLNKGDRIKMQQMQLVDWTNQAISVKEQKKIAEQQVEMMYAEQIKAVVNMTAEIEEKDNEQKEVENREYAVVNQQLAELRRHNQEVFRQTEEKQRIAELNYKQADPFLNEHRTTGISVLGGGRVRPDHWKGMTTKQLQEIFEIQKAQAAAKLEEKRRREQEEFEYAQYERAVYNLTQHANLQEQESAKEDQYAVRAHQAKQIVEKHARDAFIKEERSGKITDDFFKAFGASHR
jgi:hypothetical protein